MLIQNLSRPLSLLLLTFVAAPLLPADILRSQNVDGANTVGPYSFGQSVTTPSGGPWNNIRFNFVIGESGQLFDPNGTGAFGTLFLLSQLYAGTAAGLSAATPGFVASTSTINAGVWQFAPDVTLQPDTQYFFFTGSTLGPTQVFWLNVNNPYAGGNYFQAFSGLSFTAQAGMDAVFVLQGDVLPGGGAGVPEPGSLTLATVGLALCVLGVARRRRAALLGDSKHWLVAAGQN